MSDFEGAGEKPGEPLGRRRCVSFGCAAAIGAHRTRKRVLDKLPRRGAGLEKWRIEDKHAAKMEFGAEFYEGDSYILLAVNIAHAVAQLLDNLCGYCGVVFAEQMLV